MNNNNNKGKSGLKYVYDPEQIEFYLAHGLKPVKEGVHYKTNNKFVAFKFDETGHVWHLWKEATRERYERGDFRKNK